MKTKYFVSLVCFALVVNSAQAQSAVLGGMRFHAEKEDFADYPYRNDDISLMLAYQYHAEYAYWQIGMDYAYDPRDAEMDSIVTPSLGLYAKDGIWRGGVAARFSYLDRDESEWMDVYWEAALGLNFNLPIVDAYIYASHVFESWGEIGSFKFGELEYGAALGLRF